MQEVIKLQNQDTIEQNRIKKTGCIMVTVEIILLVILMRITNNRVMEATPIKQVNALGTEVRKIEIIIGVEEGEEKEEVGVTEEEQTECRTTDYTYI